MATDDNTHRLNALWWNGVTEPDDVSACALRMAMGDQEAKRWVLADQPGPVPQPLNEAQVRWQEVWARWKPRADIWQPQVELERAHECGIRFIIASDEDWPAALDDLEIHAPTGLWVQGPLHAHRPVSIVGARAATQSGYRHAQDTACEVSEKGWTVVSGGAFGIDIAAHQGALAAQAPTIAIMAGGLLNRYPQAHIEHFEHILALGGALVSEVPPSWRPAKWRFLGRNRLIAAWGVGTLVVEAGMRSGALATARRALELGRPVGAMPGPLTSPASEGCHELVRNGATLIRGSEDLIEMCDPIAVNDQGVLFGAPVGPDRGSDSLPPNLRRVWEALPARSASGLKNICRAAGMGHREVLTALAELELRSMVESSTAGWRRRR
ncbi:DNA-processing protein DprA [Schaalia vaccimaxillae]|uniref:DNA-processing protein DprA n=1 Tax=Schaalia vaccimaxillae TaxID=183916 RepID=UPI0003B77DA7|nr:DNA-processing protein DprA [Schaalia vaccimaxillae]